MSRPDIDAALDAVQQLLRRDLGVTEIPVDDDKVPEHLRDLVPLASMFGIGDDGTRDDAVELMPKDFIAYTDWRITDRKAIVRAWLLEGEFDETKSIFTSLMQAFEERLRSWVVPPPISSELAAKIDDSIRKRRRWPLRHS